MAATYRFGSIELLMRTAWDAKSRLLIEHVGESYYEIRALATPRSVLD